jgi:pimeloyl-ACP methyl ester carboxylesterase
VAEGDPQNPALILVHGATIPAFTYALMAPLFVDQGFFAVRYDLWGRGGSDLPPSALKKEHYVQAFEAVVAHFKVRGPVGLLGYSLGGGLASLFATQSEVKVDRLALVAPVTQSEALRHFPAVMREPKKGEIIMKIFGRAKARKRAAALFPRDVARAYADRYELELRSETFVPATLAMLRGGILEGYDNAYADLAAQKIPTFMTWGDADKEVPPENFWRLKKRLDARAEVHPDVGHGLIFKRPEAIAASLGAFFKGGEVQATPAFVPGNR